MQRENLSMWIFVLLKSELAFLAAFSEYSISFLIGSSKKNFNVKKNVFSKNLEGKGQLTYELHFNDDNFIFEWQFQKTYLNVKESVFRKIFGRKNPINL
jgi:hypothetical protein